MLSVSSLTKLDGWTKSPASEPPCQAIINISKKTGQHSAAPRGEMILLDSRAGRGIFFPGWTERTVRDSPVGANEKRELHRTSTLRAIASTVVRDSPEALCSPLNREQLLCERMRPTWQAPRVYLNDHPIQRFSCHRRDLSVNRPSCHGPLPPLDLFVRLCPVNCPRFDRPSFDPVPSRCLHSLRRGSYDVCEQLHPPTSGFFLAR